MTTQLLWVRRPWPRVHYTEQPRTVFDLHNLAPCDKTCQKTLWCDVIFATRKPHLIALGAQHQHQVPLGELDVPIVCVRGQRPSGGMPIESEDVSTLSR